MTAPEAIHLHLTPTRKRLCQDIEDGNVRWYPWVKPWACNKADRDRAVTDKVRLFERCGLAEISPRVTPGDSWAPVRLTDAGRVWAGIVKPVYYEYRIQVDGEYRHFTRLNDANDAADKAHAAGTETQIEYRQAEPEITDWVPLAWEDTLPGRLGYPRFAGYGGKVGGYTCGRCGSAPSTGVCCSSHGRQLCHACYRRTHAVEVCVEGCAKCAAEGLPVLLNNTASGGGEQQ